MAAGAKPKAARQSKGLYDVVIQRVWPGTGPEGMPVIVGIRSRCAQVLRRGAKMDKAGGGGWYMAKSGGGSGRRYICVDALMVTSKGLIVGTRGDHG